MPSLNDSNRHVHATLEQIADLACEADAVGILKQAARQLGASAAIFTSFIRDDVLHESYRFLVACSPSWCSAYQRNCWFLNDPALLHATKRSEPCRLSELQVHTKGQQKLMQSAAENGFRSGVVFPAPSAHGMSRLGVLVLGSTDAGHFEGAGYQLARLPGRLLAMELHEWSIRKVRTDLLVQAKITAEDLELLRFELHGMRSKEIAVELNTTSVSIDSRFQRLNNKLNVSTRAAAAKLAVNHGLL